MAEGSGSHVDGNGAFVLEPARPRFDPRLLDPHGTQSLELVFPGHDGLPFRGSVPQLKEDDSTEKRPQVGTQLYVDVLDLSKPDDLLHYRDVCQMVANGYAQVSYEDRQYDEDVKNWRILLRWFLNYAYVPK
jgi:hypothetical protein